MARVMTEQQLDGMMRVLSLGAGVQSSTIALMMARGVIRPAQHAIFADTQWEPLAVYEWLAWLEKQLPFPVHRVTQGDLRERVLHPRKAEDYYLVPWHVRGGIGRRQCTNRYKVIPLRRKMRALVGPRGHVEVCIGISLDEVHRMKPSGNQWQHYVWPLVDLRMTRGDCLAWLERYGYPRPPKSSCLGCPYHSDPQWQEIKDRSPLEWADVVEVDRRIRRASQKQRGEQFMHPTCRPLDEVQFTNEAQVDLFGNECEGLCGV